MKSDYKTIENLRKVSGTLPSEHPNKKNKFLSINESIEVSLEDHNANPYKAMFLTATATWGDNEYKQKWQNTSYDGRLEVVKAVLTENTLPQAREMINFIFRVRGVPRWLFDIHTLSTQFAAFMSVGCRDNDKRDSDFIFTNLEKISEEEKQVFDSLKDLYENVLDKGKGSWQTARVFLPQAYQHSYYFGQNLLSIASMKFDKNNLEKSQLKLLYFKIVDAIYETFPLIGFYLNKIIVQENNIELLQQKIRNITFDHLDVKDKKYFKQS